MLDIGKIQRREQGRLVAYGDAQGRHEDSHGRLYLSEIVLYGHFYEKLRLQLDVKSGSEPVAAAADK